MIDSGALLAWSAIALIVTLTPGPDTFLVATHAARNGARAGLAALAGIMCGIALYGALIGFGALSVLAAVPMLFAIVKTAGVLYLAWLGLGMLRSAVGGARGQPEQVTLGAPFVQGFFTNALNPKAALFYLAVLPQFAAGPNASASGVLLVAIHAALTMAWLSVFAFATARVRAFASGSTLAKTASRWLEGAVGVFFLGVAGRLALEQQ